MFEKFYMRLVVASIFSWIAQFYLRLIVASLVSWFVHWVLYSEVLLYVRFVLFGFGLSDRGFKRLTGVLINPLFATGIVTTFVITYLKVRLPMAESTGVLISLAVSYLVPSIVIGTYMKIRGALRSGEYLEWWSPLLISSTTILNLVVTIHLWVISLIINVIFTLIMAIRSIVELDMYEKTIQDAAKPLVEFLKRAEPDKPMFIITAGIQGLLVLVTLTTAYWIIGVPQLTQFIRFSLYLFIAHLLFSLVFAGMRKEKEAAQLRWINPFAIAGSFVILFTFYVAVYQSEPIRQIMPYLIFVMFLWYVCYLSRREVTIEEGKEATGSTDRDFQMDTANHTIGWFYLLLVRLQPIFLMIGLSNADPKAVGGLDGAMVYSWLQALLVTVIVMLVVGLTSLVIWARNIGTPELICFENGKKRHLAGTEGRDRYPAYRDQLASSALPYCIFVPAMVFAMLSLLGKTPLRIAGLTGVWLDALFYGLLALILFGLFVQVPFRNGRMSRLKPEFETLRKLSRKIEKNIAGLHRSNSPDGRTQLRIIAGEMTLRRLRDARQEQKGRLIYKFNLFGEGISSTDAIAVIRGVIVTALVTGLALLINQFFQVPQN